MRSLSLIALIALAALAFPMTNATAASREVTPQRYIRGVCGALATWVDKTIPIDEEVTSTIDALSTGKLTPAKAKAKVVSLYTSAAKLSDALIATTKATGTPKMSNGATLAKDHLATLTDLRDTYKAAAKAAAKLSTADKTKLYDALTTLDGDTSDKFNTVGMPLEGLQSDATLKPIIDSEPSCAAVVEAYKVSVEPTGFQVGDCVNFTTFATVACTEPHDAEVYVVTSYPADASAPYPGNDVVHTYVDKTCTDAFAPYVGIALDQSKYTYTVIAPDGKTWPQGDREIVCAVSNVSDAQLTGSVRGSGQ
jgi:hypothetical protein